MVNSNECKPYLLLASAAIVNDKGDISIDTSKTCTSLFLLRAKNQKASAVGTNGMNDSFVMGDQAEETKVMEKTPKQDVEQVESDPTTAMTDNQRTNFSTMLASLKIPALSSGLSKLFPKHSQTMAKVAVIEDGYPNPDLGSRSVTENAYQIGGEPQKACTEVVSASESTDTEKSPMTDTEVSELATGVTTASYHTEASSPAISTPEEQMALSWRQQISLLGLSEDKATPYFSLIRAKEEGDPFPIFIPRIQEIVDTDKLTVIGTHKTPADQVTVKESHQSTSKWANKAPGSSLSE